MGVCVVAALAVGGRPSDAHVAEPQGGATSSSTGSDGSVVWVALENAGKVAKVDVGRRRVLRRFEVPGAPHNITVAPNGTVATALWNVGRIAIVREGRVTVVRLGGAPHDVKVAGRVFVVANQGAARLDRVFMRGSVGRRIRLRMNPHDLAVSPNQRRAWVTLEGSDDIAIVNLVRKTVRRYLDTDVRPHDILFQPNGRRVWVTDWERGIHVFSRRGRRVRTFDVGEEPHHLAFTPDGRQVWITDHGAHRVFIISVRRLRVIATRRIRGAPHHVAITSDGSRAVVADHERGKLVVFRVSTRRKLRGMSVGAGPHGVWAAP